MKHLRFALSLALWLLASCAPPLEPITEAGRPNWHPCQLLACDDAGDAGQAYDDAVARLLGEDRPMRFTTLEKKGFFSKLFGG